MRKLVLSGKGIFTGRGSLEALEQYTYEKVMIVTGGSSMMRTGVVDRVRGMLEKITAILRYIPECRKIRLLRTYKKDWSNVLRLVRIVF